MRDNQGFKAGEQSGWKKLGTQTAPNGARRELYALLNCAHSGVNVVAPSLTNDPPDGHSSPTASIAESSKLDPSSSVSFPAVR